ncbi:MAG: protein kinase [Chroococcus sp. CMT-3BRIN-NPC107]|jgi:serine/threonine-protein kinase|nr:protein kinase [Chroococcus sp. CMT-3BRIN-NPC107]
MLENQAMIDKLLGGRYRIVATLGSGGFSQTYIAEDTHRPGNPRCAVKHLQPANNNQSFLKSARRLFNSEAETLEKLGHHDRIPRLLAYFEENQEFYLVQEFIEGQLLTNKLQPFQRWTENQVWEFVKEILEILVFIHAQGFIHRDIKPSNIIQRQNDNKLVLVDFGAVKQNWTQLLSLTSNVEMPATVGIGTPGYMPMEQARGRPRPSSDIYALGAIAVQALTGLYPMQLEEDFETGELLWREKAQVSNDFAAIITKMVRYHFKDRYESAVDALAEVQQLAPLYLPTEIGLEIASSLPLNQPLENSNTAITTLAFPVSAKPKATPNNAIPGTTIVSPLKPRSLFATRRPYYLTIGATIGAALISLGAGYAIYWQPRLQFEQTLAQLEKLKDTGKYSECITRAATIPQNSNLYADAQKVVNECKLTEAKRLATKADFKEAIALATSLPVGSSAYEQAKPLITQWYNSILALATSNYEAGKLNEAITLAQEIPSNSPVYQKAQASIKQWQAPTAKNNPYTAATVNLAATKTKPTTAAAKKVVRSIPVTYQPKTTASQPKRYPTATKKVVRRSPKVYQPKTTASQPKRYPTATKKVVRRSPKAYQPKTTASQPKRYPTATRRVQTSTANKRPALRTSSSRKYLRISKKAATNSQFKPRTKKAVKRAIARTKRSSSRQQSYRWTTKTVR